MNKPQLHIISFDSVLAGFASVCLALAKTDCEAARQRSNQEKTTGADLNRSPSAFLSLTVRQALRHCVLLQSP